MQQVTELLGQILAELKTLNARAEAQTAQQTVSLKEAQKRMDALRDMLPPEMKNII